MIFNNNPKKVGLGIPGISILPSKEGAKNKIGKEKL
jgi:hypothetical protein